MLFCQAKRAFKSLFRRKSVILCSCLATFPLVSHISSSLCELISWHFYEPLYNSAAVLYYFGTNSCTTSAASKCLASSARALLISVLRNFYGHGFPLPRIRHAPKTSFPTLHIMATYSNPLSWIMHYFKKSAFFTILKPLKFEPNLNLDFFFNECNIIFWDVS